MASAATWARRVAAWKASGRSSDAYCKGKAFTAGGLPHWAHRLRHEGSKPAEPLIRIGRVLRRAAPSAALEPEEPAAVRARGEDSRTGARAHADGETDTIVVELGVARVAVRTGFDRATLAAVIDVLSARGAGR